MKMSKERYEQLRAAIEVIADYYHLTAPLYSGKFMGLMWELHTIATNNLQYSDDHPLFADGSWRRLVPTVPGYRIYVDGLKDTHIATALRKIGKELKLDVPPNG